MQNAASSHFLFLRAARGELVERLPLWLMRQAGRYLPEYRQTRAQAGSFLQLAKNPELATEVTMQPLRRYALDAAIVFSDILVLPDVMGLKLSFGEGEGPYFHHPLQDETAIQRLPPPDLAQLDYVFTTIRFIQKALSNKLPLIGFAGSPFSLACYMIDGSGSGGKDAFVHTKRMLFSRPDLLQIVVDRNTEGVLQFLLAQIAAGVNAVMLFDTWGGLLPYHHYLHYSLAPMRRIVVALQQQAPHIPCIIFSKGCGFALQEQISSGAAVVGVDWTVSLAQAKKLTQLTQPTTVIQGNIDPVVLTAGDTAIRREVGIAKAAWGHDKGGGYQGWIFNLGHGITPQTPPEAINTLIEAVHETS